MADKIAKRLDNKELDEQTDYLLLKMLRNHQHHEECMQCVRLGKVEIVPPYAELAAHQLIIVPVAYVFRAFKRELDKNKRHAPRLVAAINEKAYAVASGAISILSVAG